MTKLVVDAIVALIPVIVVGGPVAAWVAWRKDKREEPRDQVDTLQKAVSLSGEAASAAIAANVQSAAAHSRASSAEADSAQARADVAHLRSDLDSANFHSARQDEAIRGLQEKLAKVEARLQSWITWGRRVHDEWSSLREHMTPPPLPDDLTD